MVIGATRELRLGDPRNPQRMWALSSTTKPRETSIAGLPRCKSAARCSFVMMAMPASGTYVAPTIIELDTARELKEEVFGPVLHVVRWRAKELTGSSTTLPPTVPR